MIYIYDLLLNFIDGDRLIEFYEWDSKDGLEHIKKIPLFKIIKHYKTNYKKITFIPSK